MKDQDKITTAEMPVASKPPRCPKCRFVMCEQFDTQRINKNADLATPNGTYVCYTCTPPAASNPTPTEQGATPKFTPGPWEITREIGDNNVPEINIKADGWYVAIVCEGVTRGEAATDDADANARLIAAAPELYAALERINLFACYASEENTNVREGMLLEIGKAARKAMALTETEAV